jgi:hypothetical protein
MTMVASPVSPAWSAHLRARRSLVAPAVALLGAAVVRFFGWRGPDIPAQVYRVSLFRTHGWVLWDNGWYAGHYQLPYSVLFPPLGALLGLYGAAALSAAVAAWAFAKLIDGHFGRRSMAPAILFALGTAGPVAIGQLPFLGGEAVGLLALLAAHRRKPVAAVLLAVACPLMSPVAGAFLMLALMAWALATPRSTERRGPRAALVALVLITAAPLLVLRVVFPSSGPFPFLGIDLALIVAICAIGYTWLPATHRALRAGLVLYGLTAIVVFCVPNPIGGNLVRLTVSFGPALLVALASLYRRRALLVLTVPLLIWQWSPAMAAIVASNHNHSASALTFYQPLIDELTRQPTIGRIEIPFTRSHWEAAYVAPSVPLARGWERQLDMNDNPLFYDKALLNAASYQKWLNESGVSWVALPDIALDYSARDEAKLIEADQPYLELVWQSSHWRLWKVVGSPGMTTGVGRLASLHPDEIVVDVAKAGTTTIRVRYTPAWSIVSGPACVGPARGPWTEVISRAPGRVVIGTTLLHHATNCPTNGSKD